MTIREAQPADIETILSLYAVAGLDDGTAFTAEEARAHYARFQAYPSYRLFVAEISGVAVATYALLIMDNLAKRGRPSGIVEDVAVHPQHQGQGIGRALMHHARTECRRAGCYKLVLSSNQSRQAAHRFYESLGFTRHGYSFHIEP